MTTIQTGSNTVSQDLMNAVNAQSASATTASGAPADSVKNDTDKFMTLLVTQLKNQDPLNPLDNAQLTSQLAQLSTVTGINQLNTTLESLKGSYQTSESLQATSMIGHGVLTAGSGINLSTGNALFGVNLATPADTVQVVISDATGKAIHTVDLGSQPAGITPLAWDGSTDAGGKAPDGKYTFKVVATRAGQPITDTAALTFGTVASVSTSVTDGVKLMVPGVGNVSLADIQEVL